ncbi:MAG: phenylalanine--tRNA ligase subunit beta, partial [Candidatus Rokuibacteriota bacterium]
LHAYDYATLARATIVVRRARAGEPFTTLDGQARALAEGMLLIADAEHAIGVAGVMGGANTEVSGRTNRILLEAACFQPGSIRRTSRALGLLTDAAYRFERGADIEGVPDANDRAAQMVADLAGGSVARGIVDAYPSPEPRRRVSLRMSRVRRVLGVAPPTADAARILKGLQLPTRAEGDTLEVEVPTFRRDLGIEDDLVEEVIRVWGYDKIPSTLPGGAIRLVQLPATQRQAATVRRALVGAGVLEVMTYSFSDPAYEEALRISGTQRPVAVLNPLSRDASWLRYNPLEGVLGVVATNLRRQQPNLRVFEIARTFEPAPGLPNEQRWLAIALAGPRVPSAWWAPSGEGPKAEMVDVYDAKGLVELVLDALGVHELETRPLLAGGVKGFEPDCHAALVNDAGAVVAEFGEVAAPVRVAYGVDAPVFAAAVALDVAAATAAPLLVYQALPRFPAVQRDLAFVLDAEQALTAAEIGAELAREAGPLLRQLTLFDVFRFPDGRRSLAWRLTFQAEDRTLTDDEVNRIQERVTRRATETLGIALRSA